MQHDWQASKGLGVGLGVAITAWFPGFRHDMWLPVMTRPVVHRMVYLNRPYVGATGRHPG